MTSATMPEKPLIAMKEPEMTNKASATDAQQSEQTSELTEDQLAQTWGGSVGLWQQLLQQLIPPQGGKAQQAD
ncbi:MAG: hypothetical protein WAV78_06930 [Xanthobacteraceae bacterium]